MKLSPLRFPLLFATLLLPLAFAASAHAAPLTGSAFDSGDGDQDNALSQDWQAAYAAGQVKESADANDDCFVGGVKELIPSEWAFDTSLGGCTPGKSNLRVAYLNAESTGATTFGHFAFFRNDTTGNSFLTFELNQLGTSWNNGKATIPCRSDGDVLLSFEVGGSSLKTILYKWRGTSGDAAQGCPKGGTGTFVSSGEIPNGRFQGTMNAAAAIANHVKPGTYGATFPKNSFGEAAIDLPATLAAMGESPCFGFLRMQVHSRSSSSISSAMIDYTNPVPINLQSCAITGTSYQDGNSNGQRDAGESPLAGFRQYVDANKNGGYDAGEPSGVSDTTGFYRILDVSAGTHVIRQVPQARWRCSQPSPCSYTRTLTTGGNSTDNDFGNLGPSTAAGTLFHDLDADGVEDPGEPGLTGLTVYADYDGDSARDPGEPYATTAGDGTWMVSDVAAGTYSLRLEPTAPWTCSAPAPCGTPATFASGSSVSGMKFGAWAPATIGGNVFEDVDGDGAAKEAGDVDLFGWEVYADTNGNDAFDFGEPRTTVAADGTYTLTGLKPGVVRVVRVTPAASYLCSRPGIAAATCERAVTPTSGQLVGGQDFGLSRAGTVVGTSFSDASNNGVKDGGEVGLADVTFYVDYDNDNALDADEPRANATATGAWTITGVRAGSWTVREVPFGVYACTKPTAAQNCAYASVAVASGGTSPSLEFGNHMDRSVSGVVFNDSDADHVDREAGEAPGAGVLVWAEETKDGVWTAGEPTSTTNSNGFYNLNGLANGSYTLKIAVPGGWTCSYPLTCENTGSIGSAQSDPNMNFGIYGPMSITGTVFEDSDGDLAAREAGEPGITGRTVWADTDGDNVVDAGEPQTASGAGGEYSLPNLQPGTYVVKQVMPGGWTRSFPAGGSYTVVTTAGSPAGKGFGPSHARLLRRHGP